MLRKEFFLACPSVQVALNPQAQLVKVVPVRSMVELKLTSKVRDCNETLRPYLRQVSVDCFHNETIGEDGSPRVIVNTVSQ
jgi:hypothetical protein